MTDKVVYSDYKTGTVIKTSETAIVPDSGDMVFLGASIYKVIDVEYRVGHNSTTVDVHVKEDVEETRRRQRQIDDEETAVKVNHGP